MDNRKVPVVTSPKVNRNRTLFDNGIIRRLTSIKHGVVTPFFIREVYPGDTWMIDHTLFARTDISNKVPLDDIILDTFYFYVPYRVVYPDFYRVFGEKRNSYDNTTYTIPQVTLFGIPLDNAGQKASFTNNFFDILTYRLNYSQAGEYQATDTISALPIAAYYDIINEYFLDENLDPQIPFADLFGFTEIYYFDPSDVALNNYLHLGMYQANKKFDLFTAGLISPSKNFGANVTIPLGESAPIFMGAKSTMTAGDSLFGVTLSAGDIPVSGTKGVNLGSPGNQKVNLVDPLDPTSKDATTFLYADLTQAVAADIQTFRTSLLIYSYYEMRGTIGTRRVEQLKQWGLDVSAMELDLPEYLGGESLSLSNIPVLSTQSASLGEMSGVGATMVYNDKNAWSRSFNEMGLIIGLVVSRVKHTYTQGRDNRIWKKQTDLDFYHWIYEALGNVGLDNSYIYNDPTDGKNDETFNFSPAWNPERCDWNTLSGVFSHMAGSDYSDFRSQWSYADYYDSRPVYSSSWLKEPVENVKRTLTGRLIPNAASTTKNTQQFLLEFKIHERYARIMRSHAKPANLVGVYW